MYIYIYYIYSVFVPVSFGIRLCVSIHMNHVYIVFRLSSLLTMSIYLIYFQLRDGSMICAWKFQITGPVSGVGGKVG